eukprot:CAMPEP_0115028626 /NCGR_PEP_ID=MMETSP0216-20121206/36440_1 /TAXON_ID=223996 /ORGANISM="Protocruzia adherens, Strain Boccale" /LENGTH=335 /DNA_ID=CAMNT_0002404901 /DNA_START=405 /DNA_END=1412 /DNA_ORIENTATION=-
MICQQCLPFHARHKYNDLQFYADKVKETYRHMLNVNDEYINQYEKIKSNLETTNELLDDFQSTKSLEISRYFADVREKIQLKNAIIKTKMDDLFQKELEELMSVLNEIDMTMNKTLRMQDILVKDLGQIRRLDNLSVVCSYYVNTFLTTRISTLDQHKEMNEGFNQDLNKSFNFHKQVEYPSVENFLTEIDEQFTGDQVTISDFPTLKAQLDAINQDLKNPLNSIRKLQLEKGQGVTTPYGDLPLSIDPQDHHHDLDCTCSMVPEVVEKEYKVVTPNRSQEFSGLLGNYGNTVRVVDGNVDTPTSRRSDLASGVEVGSRQSNKNVSGSHSGQGSR